MRAPRRAQPGRQHHPHVARSRQSKPFAERQKRRGWYATGLFVVVIPLWLFVLSRAFALPFLAIDTVQVEGAEPDISSAIQTAAVGALQGSYLGIFSKSNSFIYPRGAVARAVSAVSPQVESVSVSRDGLNALSVSVTEKPSAAVVCGDLPNFDSQGDLIPDTQCYLADQNGLVFQTASGTPSEPHNLYYVPDLPSPAIGSYATTTAEFVALQSFIQGVRQGGIVPEAVLMKDGGEYELYIDNPAVESPSASATSSQANLTVVYFNDTAGLDTELSDLTAFWNNMVKPSGTGAVVQPPSFESIDVRYGSNVFYRLEK